MSQIEFAHGALCDSYEEELLEDGETRIVMKLHPALAPYKVAVLPLSKKLSEKAEISLVYLGEIERGVKMPSLNTFIKLVNALNISADMLIYDETKSGRYFLADELAKTMQDLTPEQYAAVSKISITVIEQIKKLKIEE